MKNVKLTGTFSIKKRTKCKIVESEMGVWVMNLPLNYCWLVYNMFLKEYRLEAKIALKTETRVCI